MGAVFVYGTLLQGESLGHLMLAANPERIVPARSSGRLVDLGDYPGLLPARRNGQWVSGEFVEFLEVDPLLPQLDFIEVYSPGAEAGSLYLRRAVPVELEGWNVAPIKLAATKEN